MDEDKKRVIEFMQQVLESGRSQNCVDLGEDKSGSDMIFIFTEISATDGPVNRERKAALTKIAADTGFSNKNLAFLTAFMDRGASPFKRQLQSSRGGPMHGSFLNPKIL